MTTIVHTAAPGVLLTVGDVQQFEADVRRLDIEIERLTGERQTAQKMLEAASLFVGRAPPPAETAERASARDVAIETKSVPKIVRKRRAAGKNTTWRDVILKAVRASDIGLTYAEVRKAVEATALGPRLRISAKGYHNAIGRLAREGTVVREHGRLFTPPAFKAFTQAVAAGKASVIVPQPFAHSPMGEAILRIVQAQPGIAGRAIIEELCKDAEFNATLTPHHTGAYNIIARLVKRRQITRRDDGGCIPGPDFPNELVGQSPDGVGAPNGQAASAPRADRDYQSLPFPQPAASRH